MRAVLLVAVWVSVSAPLVGFVMPWAYLEVHEPELARQLRTATEATPVRDTLSGLFKDVGRITATIRRGTEQMTGELPSLADLPRQVSGVDVPRLANDPNTQMAMALAEVLTGERQQLGMKSYAVYLLPGIALVCGVLVTLLGRQPQVSFGVAALSAVIAAIGFWKLLTTELQAPFVAIRIEQGLWVSLWGYVALAVAASVYGLVVGRRRT